MSIHITAGEKCVLGERCIPRTVKWREEKNICITPSITLSLMYHASATVCHKSEFKATPVHISAEISLEAIPDDRKDHLD